MAQYANYDGVEVMGSEGISSINSLQKDQLARMNGEVLMKTE